MVSALVDEAKWLAAIALRSFFAASARWRRDLLMPVLAIETSMI